MRKLNSGGGWQALRYTIGKAQRVGPIKLLRAVTSKNACKTCAVGMGGQRGGMRNESGHFPEICKKSLQAMVADMQGRIEPRFWNSYSVAQLKALSPRELETSGRLVDPVLAGPGDTHYRVITWDEAFDHIADALKASAPEQAFFYASGRSSNEAGFLLNLFARAYGTNHVTNCSYYCHQASGAGLMESIGAATSTVALEDLDACDAVFLIGGNPASNHPRLMTKLVELRERGGEVVVINPVKELGLTRFRVPSRVRSMLLGSDIASHYLQPTIGGDIAVMAGIAKAIIGSGHQDPAFLSDATEGWEAFSAFVTQLSWDEIVSSGGVPRDQLESVAAAYGRANRVIFAWTMGITHHEHGVQNVHWIANLAMLRGMLGKVGAGLMPIRGHSNVQGLGTMGVSPKVRSAVMDRLTELGIRPATFEGLDTFATLEAADAGRMRVGFCLGGNLFGASPDANFVSQALRKIDTVVYLNTTLNTGHAHGLGKTTLILPVLARDEEQQSTTQESMFNFVRLSDGGPARHDGPRSEVEIIGEIASRTLGDGEILNWSALQSHEELRQWIAKLLPNMEKAAEIGKTKQEFEIPGRVHHMPVFKTASGKAIFLPDPLPILPPLKPDQLRLMTVRSEGQFNTVVYEEEDLYRGQERRDVILMNQVDIDRMGFETDTQVTVANEVGKMHAILVRPFDITVGCALMYYPESNVLVPRTLDPKSKTPAYKSVIVTVTRNSS